ncbi:MAG: hypothetical protein ABIA59_05380 [Candidatus Latescibacterota bacterium]
MAVTFVLALLTIPCAGHAAFQTVSFTLDGMGSLLESPVVFEGWINTGPLTNGWFMVTIDDSAWPPETNKTVRWNYLVTNFFNYDATPGGEHWDGYFPKSGTAFPVVTWHFSDNSDKLGGIVRYLIITIFDGDHDGQVDQDELAIQSMAANFYCHIEQSQGCYSGWCGTGPSNGTLSNFDPNLDDIFTMSYGSLTLRDFGCGVPVEEHTWGAVKVLYTE